MKSNLTISSKPLINDVLGFMIDIEPTNYVLDNVDKAKNDTIVFMGINVKLSHGVAKHFACL